MVRHFREREQICNGSEDDYDVREGAPGAGDRADLQDVRVTERMLWFWADPKRGRLKCQRMRRTASYHSASIACCEHAVRLAARLPAEEIIQTAAARLLCWDWLNDMALALRWLREREAGNISRAPTVHGLVTQLAVGIAALLEG